MVAVIAWVTLFVQVPTGQTGPGTEGRFPPLRVPTGFRATLFACDPLIEYPSAIALGPRPGTVFVAVDYMTGLGTEIVRRDEIRLLADNDGDGYAEKSTVYAGGFNSIEGLTFHDGTVYAMHSPLLTALRDTDDDGVADERRDLLSGLGLAPEENPPRLHCANGIVWGEDGWLYLALGDHGCSVPRPEGDRLVLEGGGILRCRTDGRDLHTFATGLRNIYDVALDDDLNVFVRDNENDGGDYKIRVYHSFFGADHGYPYLYHERPDEAMAPLADLGLGSSAGGVAYRGRQFPPEYQGNLFFCEWGRSVVRYLPQPLGSGFAPMREIEFASGGENDPYGFKPTDLVVERDGSLLIADWGDGQRPKRGRGRIYRVRHVDLPRAADAGVRLEASDRRLTVWETAKNRGPIAIDDLFAVARTDPDPRVRVQAIRAIADLVDPVLAQHRLAPAPSDPQWGERLAALANDRDPRVVREIIIAIGRVGWPGAPQWLGTILRNPDTAMAHAAMWAMRRAANWPSVIPLLDRPNADAARVVALRAIAGQYHVTLVDALLNRLQPAAEADAARRREYADASTRLHQKPATWAYWGYRPPPRPANSVAWERSKPIEQALDRVLRDPDVSVRLATLRRMQRERIATQPTTLATWLADERDAERVTTLLASVQEHRPETVRDALLALIREPQHTIANRLAALAIVTRETDRDVGAGLLELGKGLEDGPVLAAVLREFGRRPAHGAGEFATGKLRSVSPDVRMAAADTLAELRITSVADAIEMLLADSDPAVRRSAASALGRLGIRSAAGVLLARCQDPDAGVRRACFDALRLLDDRRVLPAAIGAADDGETALEALRCVAQFGSPEHARLVAGVAARQQSIDILHAAFTGLTRWRELPASEESRRDQDHALAGLQGTSGVLASWNVVGPLPADAAEPIVKSIAPAGTPLGPPTPDVRTWLRRLARGGDSSFAVVLSTTASLESTSWIAVSDFEVASETAVQVLASSSGRLRVWLNGRLIHERAQPAVLQPDSDQFDATLAAGPARIVFQVSGGGTAGVTFHARFRRKSLQAEREKLVQMALVRTGNVERGKKVFFDIEKSQCLKCHRLDGNGERVGPELTNLADRFSRVHIVESIVEPNRTIAPSFESVSVGLTDGRVVSGLRVVETETSITLVDGQAQRHLIPKAAIADRRVQPTSIMPEGLEKRLAVDEFVDLIAFLLQQRGVR